MAAEAVKVIVRCRPLNNREKSLDCKDVVVIDTSRGQCSILNPARPKEPPKLFSFDGAFGIDSTTEQIYADIVYPLVDGVTEGYNGTIFAYGQTGCGKSFTMQGITADVANKGITPRSFEHIFETTSTNDGVKYLVHASFLEIYNEEIRDLLGKDQRTKYDLKEHPEKGVFVSGLSIHKVKCVDDCRLIMEQGWKNRHVGATLMNADSSRSHSLFTIYLEMATTDASSGTEHICAGKLNLVDLAGSERQSKTGATGDRLKEATKINLSLSALGNVISALVDATAKHVPYRDSKLTRLLQDSLGGNTKTLMVACLSPADNNYDETLSTLRYANRAKNIKNKPTINEDPKDALLRQYQEEINRLKSLLDGKMPVDSIAAPPEHPRLSQPDLDAFEKEKEQIKGEYERKLKEKEVMYAAEAANSAKLQEDMSRLKEMYDTKLQKLETRYKMRPTSDEDHLSYASPPSSFLGTVRRASDSESLPTLRLDKLSPLAKRCSENEPEATTTHTTMEESVSSRKSRFSDGTTTTQRTAIDEGIGSGHGSGVLRPVRPQFAVHLASTSLVGVTTPLDGISGEYDKLTKNELLRRLRLLEDDMVGGELLNNMEVRERRSRRRQHAEERKRLLAEANANLDDEDDEGIMVGIYESIQDELRHKNKLLQKEKQKTGCLKTEIEDLQHEFERDREDYLESIRKQNNQIALLEAILGKVQPCIRRDSNYANIDRIKKQACFDEDANEWILPTLSVERTALPLPITSSNNMEEHAGRYGAGFISQANSAQANAGYRSSKLSGNAGNISDSSGMRDTALEKEEETRFYAKLASRAQNHTNYFANKRKEQLLMDAAFVSSSRSAFRSGDRQSQQSKDPPLNNSNNLLQTSHSDPSVGSKWSRTRNRGSDGGPSSSTNYTTTSTLFSRNKNLDL